jgi:hypothetical protein
VERSLIEQGWTKVETEKAFSEIAMNLDTDLEPLLASESVSLNKEKEVAG